MRGRENLDREDDFHLSMSKIYHVISPDIVVISCEAHCDFPRLFSEAVGKFHIQNDSCFMAWVRLNELGYAAAYKEINQLT